MYNWLQRVWYENAPSGVVLLPLGWLFGALTALRRCFYRAGLFRSYSVGRPVIVIGNITVGGTGKTPLTLWLTQRLKERELNVGIVMRGYGSRGGRPRLVSSDDSYEEVGDEALLLACRSGVPVAVGVDRVAASRLLVEKGVDIIIADDGLQHLRLKREFEIAVIDGARRFGNGRLLPAGPLRESTKRLAAVDALVVNGEASALDEISMFLTPGNAVSLDRKSFRPLTSFAGQRVHALAGIGNPERFFKMLETAGVFPVRHPLPDHVSLMLADIEFPDELPVLMTEKDAVKCGSFAAYRHWFVPVDAVIPADHQRSLLEKCARRIGFVSPAR